MKLVWLGHSAFLLETGGAKILIDPFLTGNGTFEGSGVSHDDVVAGTTHVLLTHGHDDHVGDAVDICMSQGASLITVFELASYLNGKGVEKIDPVNPGGTIQKDDFTVSFVSASHSSSTMVDGKPVYLGASCGLVIQAEGMTIYHMGDTDVISDMAVTQDLYQPDVGLVPIGDRFTMGAKSAAYACKKFFSFKTIVPIHFGTFPIIDQSADAFVAAMDGHNVVVPDVGKEIAIG